MSRAAVKKITVYEASDGVLFRDKAKYVEHQRRLDLTARLKPFVDREFKVDGHRWNGDARCVGLFGAVDVLLFLVEHATELNRLITGKIPRE